MEHNDYISKQIIPTKYINTICLLFLAVYGNFMSETLSCN